MKPEICIGTAQFGMDYGITNKKGKIKLKEIKSIFKYATKNEIKFLDTAQQYGNAEKNIGLNLPDDNNFQIITKTCLNEEKIWSKNSITSLNSQLHQSLERLKVDKLNSILFHRSSDLIMEGNGYLFQWIDNIITQGLVGRVGVSIYEPFELDKIPFEIIKIVQLPLSIYDQRMIKSGTINRLINKGVAIHARSIFLQGVLLEKLKLPSFLSNDFRNHHNRFVEFCKKQNISLLDGAVGFISGIKELEATVFGISCKKDLVEIHDSFIKSKSFSIQLKKELCRFDWQNPKDLDPRQWVK